LKKVGKTTRSFRYDLNQIPYDYTVEVRNRFKGLDLIDRVPDELWSEVCDVVQETGIKTIPVEKKCKQAKWLSAEALQIAVKRREAKSKGEKERYRYLNAEFQRIARRDKKAFLSDQCKEIDVFLELSCFFYDPVDVGNLISGSSAFSKTSLNIRKFTVHILLKPGLENL